MSKYSILCFSLTIIILLFLHQIPINSPDNYFHLLLIKRSFSPQQFSNYFKVNSNHCFPFKNQTNGFEKNMRFVFLKVHKCGSSLLYNLLKTWMVKNGISWRKYGGKDVPSYIQKDGFNNRWIGGYPGPYLDKYGYVDTINNNLTVNKKLYGSSIINHFIWNLPELEKSFTNPETGQKQQFFKIGIVRNPLSLYISSFNFYFGRQKSLKKHQEMGNTDNHFYNSSSVACFSYPFIQQYQNLFDQIEYKNFTDDNYYNNLNLNNNLTTYLSHFDTKIKANSINDCYWGWRGKNTMSKDFGLDWKEKISHRDLSKVVNQFDFIIVLERLTESLILLKHILCMEMDDIILANVIDKCPNNSFGKDCGLKGQTKSETYKKSTYETIPKYSPKDSDIEKFNLSKQNVSFIEENYMFNDINLYNLVGLKFHQALKEFGFERMRTDFAEYHQKSNLATKRRTTRKRRSFRNLKLIESSGTIITSDETQNYWRNLGAYMKNKGGGYCPVFDSFFFGLDER